MADSTDESQKPGASTVSSWKIVVLLQLRLLNGMTTPDEQPRHHGPRVYPLCHATN